MLVPLVKGVVDDIHRARQIGREGIRDGKRVEGGTPARRVREQHTPGVGHDDPKDAARHQRAMTIAQQGRELVSWIDVFDEVFDANAATTLRRKRQRATAVPHQRVARERSEIDIDETGKRIRAAADVGEYVSSSAKIANSSSPAGADCALDARAHPFDLTADGPERKPGHAASPRKARHPSVIRLRIAGH